MAEKYLNITGLRELVSRLRRKERTVRNTTWVGDAVPWETIIVDNSSLNYSAGASFGITPRRSVVVSSPTTAKRYEFVIITGANTARLAFYEYLHCKPSDTTMQANSVYVARVYGIGTETVNGTVYGKTAYIELVRLGDKP
ncbi:MAG: hypothetical protein SPL43_04020 [Prevotella sp.]|nr:hypothetical protein [Prevotella sp.]